MSGPSTGFVQENVIEGSKSFRVVNWIYVNFKAVHVFEKMKLFVMSGLIMN